MNVALLTRSAPLAQRALHAFARAHASFDQFSDVRSLLSEQRRRLFDVILIDSELMRELKDLMSWRKCQQATFTPVIVVGWFSSADAIVEAVREGVTDVVVEPFDENELVARGVLALSSAYAHAPGHVGHGRYDIDDAVGVLMRDQTPIILSDRELALMRMLLSNVGITLTRLQISQAVWGHGAADQTLAQFVHRVRRKTGLDGRYGLRLRSVYARGYRLEATLGAIPLGQDPQRPGLSGPTAS